MIWVEGILDDCGPLCEDAPMMFILEVLISGVPKADLAPCLVVLLVARSSRSVHLFRDLIEERPMIVAFHINIEVGSARQESEMRFAA